MTEKNLKDLCKSCANTSICISEADGTYECDGWQEKEAE
jgi:hypothetical protein